VGYLLWVQSQLLPGTMHTYRHTSNYLTAFLACSQNLKMM
jgi:hypothetical protein